MITTEQEKDTKIRIKAVGDIAPGDSNIVGFGLGSLIKKYGCDYPFSKMVNQIAGSDILIGNLEGALSSRCRNENIRLAGLPEMAFAIKSAGFDVISLANNHVYDHGFEVFNETVKYCKEAGLKICGLRGKNEYYSEPVILEKKGRNIGLLAYNWIGLEQDNNHSKHIANVTDGVVNYTWNRDKKRDKSARVKINEKNRNVINDISKLKKTVDIIILLPHWGYEWTIYPPYGVVLEARSFIDAGADCIIGAHPHVPQGIELYKNKMIAYSLGNFIFDTSMKKYDYGMVLKSDINTNNICDYNYTFIRSDKMCQPIEANMNEQKENSQLIKRSTEIIMGNNAEEELDDDYIYKKYNAAYNRMKIRKIFYLLKGMIVKPSMIKPIAHKCINLFSLIMLRLKGEKIRW